MVVFTFHSVALAQDSAASSARPTRYMFEVVSVPDSISTLVGGINDRDQISGWYVGPGGIGTHGFILEEGEFTSFDVPGAVGTTAAGINDRAQVVGNYQVEFDPIGHGFIYDAGQITTLDVPFAGAQGTSPLAINHAGTVVGNYFDAAAAHGFIYQRGKFKQLDVPFAGAHETMPSGINDHGVVVGAYFDANGVRHGFSYESGRFTRVDEPGMTETVFNGIDDRGRIVGWASSSDGPGQQEVHAFVYERGRFRDFVAQLPNVDVGITQASAIADSGEIVGTTAPPNGGVITSFVARPR